MTTPSNPPPDHTRPSPGRAEHLRLGTAIRASTLSPVLRLVLWTAVARAAEAADAGEKFTLSIEELAEQTGMWLGHVARCLSDLIAGGWFTRTEAGWTPSVPAPKDGP